MPSPGVASTWGVTDFVPLILEHLHNESVVLRSGARAIPIRGTQAVVPRLLDDGDAVWVAEGAEIPSDAPDADTITLNPKKVANVVTLSNESIRDADVDTLDRVGQALARSIATRLDLTLFDATAASATRPAGLRSAAYTLPGEAATAIGDAASIDLLLNGIGAIRNAGGNPNAIYMNAGDMTSLTKLKEATGSNRPLLQPEGDITQRPVYRIGGAILYPLPTAAIPAGVAIVADASQLVVGVRQDPEVAFSSHSKFTADSVVARVTARFDWEPAAPNGFYHLT